MRTVHIFVSGLVQGVNFRYYTQKKAMSSTISGWVKNLVDGRVEIIARGNNENIDTFIEWLKIGPPSAEVKNLEIVENDKTALDLLEDRQFSGFQIID